MSEHFDHYAEDATETLDILRAYGELSFRFPKVRMNMTMIGGELDAKFFHRIDSTKEEEHAFDDAFRALAFSSGFESSA